MFPSVSECLLLFLLWLPSECRLQDHRTFQYNAQVDGRGTYNFAYDTSHQPQDAHSLHMEYRDANGIVRGRYGYTDPRGKLRIVEYEAGPEGFKARGDVGPDLFPHMEAPGLSPQKPDPTPTPLRTAGEDPVSKRIVTDSDYYSSYSLADKKRNYARYYDRYQAYSRRPSYPVVSQTVDPDVEVSGLSHQEPDSAPTPLRMAGWDPVRNPINEKDVTDSDYHSSYSFADKKPRRGYIRYYDRYQEAYRRRPSYLPVVSQTVDPDVEVFQQDLTTKEKKNRPLTSNQPLTIYNIDVDPDEIRVAGPPVGSQPAVTTSRPVYRGREIIATSPELRYYERPSRRTHDTSHSYYSHHGHTSDYYSGEQSIQRPRQVRYRPASHYHDRQYYFE